jgi:thioredoxin reductase (NADPH)
MGFEQTYALYLVPLVAIWAMYFSRRWRAEARNVARRAEAAEAGLLEPASLHPYIDPVKCLGCGSCTRACPEDGVLGLINGRAELVEPAHCIGHGACRTACPTGAIALVFGTEKRGVDIPNVGPDFQTNVPGIFIAGELGGMGLIRNAVEQGRQAIESVRRVDGLGTRDVLDVVIVGSGPAGFAASLAAIQHNLRFATVEQETFGGTIAHYPRGKLVLTAPVVLPMVGHMKFREVSKERLLAFFQKAARETGLEINYRERVESITRIGSDFEVKTTRQSYRTRTVLLAIGRRGTPRKLDVPGEDQPKVVYRLVDPAQYRRQRALVVGGGDSALEAAASIAELPGAQVILSHRSDAFSRAKRKNRERIEAAIESGRLRVLLQSQVTRIGTNDVEIDHRGRRVSIKNDAVIVCAGGILPTHFLKTIGIDVETKYGTT